MTMQSGESSHPLLSCADGIAASTTDLLLLVGRVFLGWLFLASSWPKLMNIAGFVGYLTALKAPAPEIMAWIGASVEFLIGVTLILGIATRYAALLCALFLIVATALAHRYWEYPPAQMQAQYSNFLKNLAILGGALLLFLTGRDASVSIGLCPNRADSRSDRQLHSSLLARRAPCASASSFAHMIEGWTRR
jgi:putative oxidoreductase